MREHDETSTTDRGAVRITWLGHSTLLVELDGVRLLTDPVLRGRIAHLRRVAAPVDPAAVAGLDAVLVSHLHYDHLDLPSLRRLDRTVRVVVPKRGGGLLRRRGWTDVVEVEVGDEVQVGTVAVRATPAEHVGRRGPLGTSAPAVGYLLDGSSRLYFAGDTDLFEGMTQLAHRLDVALLPIAGWGWRVPAGHLNPLRAVSALALLRPRVAVPIHWGTYRTIGMRRHAGLVRAPAEEFLRLARELAPDVDVRLLPVGGRLELEPAQRDALPTEAGQIAP